MRADYDGKREEEHMGRKRRKLHEYGAENDIRYSGPLSYQHFQMLGWACIVLSVMGIMLGLAGKISKPYAEQTAGLLNAINYVKELSLPFLLLANFAKILNNSEGYRKQLLKNGLAMAAMALFFLFFYDRYIVGTVRQFILEQDQCEPLVLNVFNGVSGKGFLAINIFVDLFLCTLFMFFLNYRPKKVLTGKKVLILRACAVLPVAYEICSLYLKGLSAAGGIKLPSWTFPLLTVKPPVTFVVFMVLAIHIKVREYRYCRHGKTHEEYHVFLQTRRNSFHFSVFTAIILVFFAIVDFLILSLLLAVQAGSVEALKDLATEDGILHSVAYAMGFGDSIVLIAVAPIMLLFSYNRIPKNKTFSLLIPIIAIALIILEVIEGIHQLLGSLPIRKMPIEELKTYAREILAVLESQSPGPPY